MQLNITVYHDVFNTAIDTETSKLEMKSKKVEAATRFNFSKRSAIRGKFMLKTEVPLEL